MTALMMPKPNAATLAKRAEIIAQLRDIVPGEGVVDTQTGMRVFESDGLTAYRQMPMVVVLPETTAQVSRILKYCQRENIKVVPRGSGTSLSGGALPLADAVLLVMSRFSRILDIDLANRVVVAQPGVTNLGITRAVEEHGFYYAPDPSSQIACSIGGNVAENSGGVHSLKYGLTASNVLGVEMVLISGEIIRLGGKHLDSEGYDLLGLMTGSEGLLGVVTEVTVRVLQKPETARAALIGFASSEEAGQCVADIIGAGIIPGGMEMMDRPAIHAAEDFVHAGYPRDVEALLIVELDGPEAEVDDLLARVSEIASKNNSTTLKVSTSEDERLMFWAGRKAAFPAAGRISPDYYCMDGTIPRKELPKVLKGMRQHVGKIRPCASPMSSTPATATCTRSSSTTPTSRANWKRPRISAPTFCASASKSAACLTGEHGVGVEKRDLMPVMFNETDLDTQMRVKCAFDPEHLLNPGKVFPQLQTVRGAGADACAAAGRCRLRIFRGFEDERQRFPPLATARASRIRRFGRLPPSVRFANVSPTRGEIGRGA